MIGANLLNVPMQLKVKCAGFVEEPIFAWTLGEKQGHLKKEYGADKGEKIFYASENKGTIKGVTKKKKKKGK